MGGLTKNGHGRRLVEKQFETRPVRTLAEVDVQLTGPARQRLIDVAADLIGKVPVEDLPASLRPIAKFKPDKRRRLGVAAIAAALETSAGLRAALVELLAGGAEELVEAVAGGSVPPAADPLDTIVIAYLARPENWAELVTGQARRWSDEQAPSADSAELGQLRAEVAELRAAARQEPARTRDAVAAAGAEAGQRLTTLRSDLRARTRELKEAQAERQALREECQQLQRRLATVQGGHDAEVRRLRGRLAELERAAETARRDARADRDLDDARLALLIDTLVQAAGGLRRELSLPPTDLLPADTVVSGSSGGGAARFVNDASALERLLAVPKVHLIVDGYNVTKGAYGDQVLADQRSRLINGLARVYNRCAAEVTVAFDGADRPAVQPPSPRGVRVLFSVDESADDLIRRLVGLEPPGRPVVVVTNDQQVIADVFRAGAYTAPSGALTTLLG